MKLALRLALSCGLSGLFLYLAFRNVDLNAMWGQMLGVGRTHVLVYLLSLILIQICRVLRWGVLVAPFAHVSRGALFRIANLGMLLVVALPLRLGELARPYLLKQESGAPITSGLGAVTVERTVDGLVICLLFFITTVGLDAPYAVPASLRAAALVALGLFVAAAVVIVVSLFSLEAVKRVTTALARRISTRLAERVNGLLEAFVAGLRAVPNRRAVASLVVLTLLYWAANGLGLYWVMRGFGWDLPPSAGFVLVCVIVIGIMIPAGPAFLGTFQGAVLAGLSIFGVSSTDAAAFGAVVYPPSIVVVAAFGVPYLFGRGAVVRASLQQVG